MSIIHSFFTDEQRTYNNTYNFLKELPLDYRNGYGDNSGYGIWGLFAEPLSDECCGAKINRYCVPTDEYIELFCYIGGDTYSFRINDSQCIDEIRYLEEKRNNYIEYKKSKGTKVTESIIKGRRFDLYGDIDLGWVEYVDGEPNNYVSEELEKLRNGITYCSKEDFNYRYVNWINNNIDRLAVLGFYDSNFPDIVLFEYGRRSSIDLDLRSYEYEYRGNRYKWPIVHYEDYPEMDEDSLRFKASELKYGIRDRIRAGINSFMDAVLPNRKIRKAVFIALALVLLFIFKEYVLFAVVLLIMLLLIYFFIKI